MYKDDHLIKVPKLPKPIKKALTFFLVSLEDVKCKRVTSTEKPDNLSNPIKNNGGWIERSLAVSLLSPQKTKSFGKKPEDLKVDQAVWSKFY